MSETCCVVYLWLPGRSAASTTSGNLVSHLMRHIPVAGGNIGHAALQIGDRFDAGKYVSWWPEGRAGMMSWLPGRKYSAAPKGFAADNVAEGSRHKNAALSQHSSLLQLFPSGEFDREKMELAFHENLLHQALGMKAVDMNWKLQIDFQDNQSLFMMEMAQQLKRQLSSAKSDIERLLPVEAQDSTPWRINLSGLNEQAMLDAWLQIKGKSNGHYRIFRKNCATVVHRVLAAGGADQLAGWSASHAGVWTLGRLFNYCMKVQGRSVMSAA